VARDTSLRILDAIQNLDLIPELEKRQASMERMLKILLERTQSPSSTSRSDELLTGQQFRHKYHIGNEKLWTWVKEGRVEFIGERGTRSQRFRMVG
jgi:hypothetical protein